jgi:hypothetical protein
MGHKAGTTLGLISGAAIGAGLMYLADPDRGTRRRSGVRDKAVHGVRSFGGAIDKGIRDLRNRIRGAAAEAWCAVKAEEVSDEVLADRVRAKIGRVVSHPSAIEVTAKDREENRREPIPLDDFRPSGKLDQLEQPHHAIHAQPNARLAKRTGIGGSQRRHRAISADRRRWYADSCADVLQPASGSRGTCSGYVVRSWSQERDG